MKFENEVHVNLHPHQTPDRKWALSDFDEGLTWRVRSTDTKVRACLRASEERPLQFIGTLEPASPSNQWPKVLLPAVRAGCKLKLTVSKAASLNDAPVKSPLVDQVLSGVVATLDLSSGTLHTASVGARFRGNEAIKLVRQLQRGELLTLKPEKDNPHDPQAIAVFCGKTQIGYVPREDNPLVNFLLEKRVSLTTRAVKSAANPSIDILWTWGK